MIPENVSSSTGAIVTRRADGEPVTSTMMIAAGTLVQHKNVIELVRRYKSDLESFGLVTFLTEARVSGHGGGETVYAMLNEHQATLVIAYMRNSEVVRKFKVDLVRCFYEMRAALRSEQPAVAPRTLREALILALAQEEKIGELETKITTDAPKVAFAETIRALDGVCSIESIAKTLGIGRNKLFKRMKGDKVLMPNNLPYQKYIDRAYFTVAEGEPYVDSKKVAHPTFTTKVTGAGQVFLARKYATPEMETAS